KFKRMPWDAAKPLGEGFRVAMSTSGTDFRAATHRIPGCVRPFNLGIIAHGLLVLDYCSNVQSLFGTLPPKQQPSNVNGSISAFGLVVERLCAVRQGFSNWPARGRFFAFAWRELTTP